MNGSKTAAKLTMLAALGMAACVSMTSARAVTIDWVTVGDAGNVADSTGYGAVADSFRIMKFEFTNQQYAEFLNAVDPNGTNPYSLYNAGMGSDARGGITNTGVTNGSRYAVKANMGDKPVNYVSWWDAARVANWLQNGQGSGSTETGAYTFVNGQTIGSDAPAKNAGAQFYVPTQDQWYKAAYYSGGSTNAGYWNYATQSNEVPTPVTSDSTGIGSAGNTGNFANYTWVASWNDQVGNLTTVGTNGGPSAYGAFDMGGNASEWNDLTGTEPGWFRGLRGGFWGNYQFNLSRAADYSTYAHEESSEIGFRLGSEVNAVPEPSTYAMALAGIACGGFSMWRRRKRA